jgi:MtrB/PioB family decaheme-associated outer membrane protein
MKRRNGLVRICVIGAALSGVGWVSTGALAQTATPATDAWAKADPVPYWWFHGTVEAGGRFFLNDPERNGSRYLGGHSLAKFYEYSDLRPGAVSDIAIATGSNDGLYQVDIGGKNIGYDDQSYYLDASKAGEQYFNFEWDQTPHVYSTSAQTFYQGVGTQYLTLPPGYVVGGPISQINKYLYTTDLGIRRDTASASYRWTPSDPWDIRGEYSHMSRNGTQIDGVVIGGFSNPGQVPRPVSDTTQNYGVNGEYMGTSPWGKRFTFKVGYNGSQYTDDYSAYWIATPTGTPTPAGREIGLWPSNKANGFSGTLAADLPWMSRYVGTVSYTMMRQDAAFIEESLAAHPPVPATSLNGAINTLLSNNVLTTKLTSDLTNKLSYRYYNFDNDTPEILFPTWTGYDRSNAGGAEGSMRSLSMQYTKQNVMEELNWRPSREWNLGTGYGYERYDWTRADVDATNEHSGKVFADWKPMSWFGVRSSGYYGNRRYENYDYLNNVGLIQFPQPSAGASTTSWIYQSSYRQLMIDNRQTWKANVSVDFAAMRGLTLTPTFKYKHEIYGVDPANQQGLEDRESWSAGIDGTYLINPTTSIMLGYMREYAHQTLYSCDTTPAHTHVCASPTISALTTNDDTTVDTFTALLRYVVIPDKLDTALRYTLSHAVDAVRLTDPVPANGQFPDYTTWYQRFDATTTYKFDKQQVAFFGWKGDVKAKLHYVWERNSVDNWANDTIAPLTPVLGATSYWMAYDNPNYDVHMLMASLAFTW